MGGGAGHQGLSPLAARGPLHGVGEEPPGFSESGFIVDFVLPKPLTREALRQALAPARILIAPGLSGPGRTCS